MHTNAPAMETMPYFRASLRKVSENLAWDEATCCHVLAAYA